MGLTGGMGAGKSTALDALRDLGAAVLSTDRVVHELYRCDRVREALVGRWGEAVAPGGVVDRQAVAEHAFAGADERRWLEETIWPLVGERVAVWLALARNTEPPARAAVVEMPLLFESGMDRVCDATIAVIADEEVCRERLAERDQARTDERRSRQLSQHEKAERATFVVRNDGSLEQLRDELSSVLGKLGR
ncbi:MAG: dephospho-CoA kinase [Acidobacteriota bacterium]|nr:dephospho-CoA kinase [Acidobacteriota bacterium]